MPATKQSVRARRVLVVEDTTEIAEFLRLVLEEDGFITEVATSGSEAVPRARAFRPELVTLDLRLPEISGVDVLRRLKADPELRDIPVVIVSAYVQDLTSADRANVAAIVPKPFEVDHLVEVVERFV